MRQGRTVALRVLQACCPVQAGAAAAAAPSTAGGGGTLGATGAWVWTPFLKNQLSMSMAAEKWHGPAPVEAPAHGWSWMIGVRLPGSDPRDALAVRRVGG
jgi:hypothetical protein